VPVPVQIAVLVTVSGAGQISVPLSGGSGPAQLVVQAVVLDPAQSLGFALSNAVMMEFLP
jgi:hypothetical protein